MAQIVIDIDGKTYKAFMELISINLGRSNYKGIIGKCLDAIKHGKPLPKGHGRLIDGDKLLESDRIIADSRKCHYIPMIDVYQAPTVIEADEEGSEDKQ